MSTHCVPFALSQLMLYRLLPVSLRLHPNKTALAVSFRLTHSIALLSLRNKSQPKLFPNCRGTRPVISGISPYFDWPWVARQNNGVCLSMLSEDHLIYCRCSLVSCCLYVASEDQPGVPTLIRTDKYIDLRRHCPVEGKAMSAHTTHL